MKKLLIAALLFAGLAAVAPKAEAGQYAKIFGGYDRCGRPVYSYVPKSYVYGYSYQPTAYDRYEVKRRAVQRVLAEQRHRYNDRDDCYRDNRRSPRVSVYFGR